MKYLDLFIIFVTIFSCKFILSLYFFIRIFSFLFFKCDECVCLTQPGVYFYSLINNLVFSVVIIFQKLTMYIARLHKMHIISSTHRIINRFSYLYIINTVLSLHIRHILIQQEMYLILFQ